MFRGPAGLVLAEETDQIRPVGLVFGDEGQVFDCISWGGVHEEISPLLHGPLHQNRLVGKVAGTCAEDVAKVTQAELSDLEDQVVAGSLRPGFVSNRTPCNLREHAAVDAIDAADGGLVKGPGLATIDEQGTDRGDVESKLEVEGESLGAKNVAKSATALHGLSNPSSNVFVLLAVSG